MLNLQIRNLVGEIIYKNNHVNNIYEACTCCYDNTKEIPYEEKKKYIEKRINAGHESMLEHGRLAIKISNIDDASLIAELTTLEYSKWLSFYSIHKENDEWNLIINGTMRGYKYFITNITDNDYECNMLIRIICYLLTNNTVAELYGKEFKLSELQEFVDMESFNTEDKLDTLIGPSTGIQYDTTILDRTIDIATTDNTKPIKKVDIGIDVKKLVDLINDIDITPEILFDIIPVTVLFKNMSRTATHQLVRHRNAITQESQRYVSANEATFTIPVPEYDESKYKITLFGKTEEVTLSELAKELLNVYPQLVNAGLKKEEARAYLPSNVNCKRLYMTFSLSTLSAFLHLRCDEHAQYEIRCYANAIKETISLTLKMFGIDYDIK